MTRAVRLVPERHGQPVRPSLLAAWTVVTILGAVLLLPSLSRAAAQVLPVGDRPAVIVVLVATLAGALAGWALSLLLGRVRDRAGDRAAHVTAVGIAALGLAAVVAPVLAESGRFAAAVGPFDVDGAPVSTIGGVVGGLLVAILSMGVLRGLRAVRVAASPRPGRALGLSAWILGLLFAAVATFGPEGVNAAFAMQAWAPTFAGGVLAVLVIEAIDWQPRDGEVTSDAGARSRGLVLAVLPMVPVARYLVVNRTAVSISGMALVLIAFAAAAAVVVLVVPRLLRPVADPVVVQVVLSGWSFALLNMAAVSDSQAWHGSGGVGLQALTFVGVIAFLLLMSRAPAQVLTWGVLVFLGLEVANAYMTPAEDPATVAEGEAGTAAPAPAPAPGADDGWSERPDIHLLVYESYANAETMAAYGFDNSDQMAFLEEQGFEIHHGTYSVGGSSLSTMSRLLQASSVLEREMASVTAGDSYVTDLLSAQGYRTYGVFYSDYLYGDNDPGYDVNVPGRISPWRPMLTSILRGEFRASESFNTIEYDDYLETKRRVLASASAQPRFMYTHNKYPNHSQNSGRCLHDEKERYFRDVEVANEEMRQDLATVDRNAIIIIAADHGPYLTKNCTILGGDYPAEEVERLDVQDRYGTFLAIRWPESFDVERRPVVVQDVFPLVFAEVSGDSSHWDERRVEPITHESTRTSGVVVDDGVIRGGVHDGEPLFLERAP